MPFCISNSCATFQRAFQIVLSGLKYDTCLCYFDDIIIPSIDLEQQCERLELLLSCFRQHNRHVKASKCCFGADKVTYLGHVVSAAGIHTDPKKIKAVASLENVEQVWSFLGLAGYYRNFILNFVTLSAPLVQLAKKGSKFKNPLRRSTLSFNSSPYYVVPPFLHICSLTNAFSYKQMPPTMVWVLFLLK